MLQITNTKNGGYYVSYTFGRNTYRKYTHPSRNKPKRLAYDIAQVVNHAHGSVTAKQVKVTS